MSKTKPSRRSRRVIDGVAFRKRLRWLLDTSGVSAREAGERAGVSHGAVGNLLSGLVNDPGVGLLSALSEVFGCSLDWLVCGSGEAPTPEALRLVPPRQNHAETSAVAGAA